MIFDEWERLFGVVYGEDQLKLGRKGLLADTYNVSVRGASFSQMLFAIHTYYALLMKTLATELVAAQSKFMGTFLGSVSRAELQSALEELEDGTLLKDQGISNLIEQDFFGWYLAAWSEDLAESVWTMFDLLKGYDIGTFVLTPEECRDLLKDLYHGLVPQNVRHALGEYYTPDWLAEHTLALTNYSGNPAESILDPACGSGTFLIAFIRKVHQWLRDHAVTWGSNERKQEALELIQRNVVGFDLNPLAVIASRTNYLLALGDLIRYKGAGFELPVYLTDSVLLPSKVKTTNDLFASDTVKFPVTVGTFDVPRVYVDRRLVRKLMNALHNCIVSHAEPSVFVALATDMLEATPSPQIKQALSSLFMQMRKLDDEGKNRVWAHLIHNRYAAIQYADYFDYIVGNPPHINWEHLPTTWRDEAQDLFKTYGMFTLEGRAAQHGGAKKDIAALFTYAVIDHFLKMHARIALVVHVSLFKTTGAGEGFRRFRLGEGTPFRIDVVHDFSSFQPFQSESGMKIKTRTATFAATKGESTTYPIAYHRWSKTRRGFLPGNLTLPEALSVLSVQEEVATPLRGATHRGGLTPWLTVQRNDLEQAQRAIAGDDYRPAYEAHAGLYTLGLNGVYFVRTLETLPSGLRRIENLYDDGKNKVKRVMAEIEATYLYPLLRGRDVSRWSASPSCDVVMVQDPDTQVGIPLATLQTKAPLTERFLAKFKDELAQRKGLEKFFGGKPNIPYYTMYDIGNYTLGKHKVVWMDLAGIMKAAVVGKHEGRVVVPEHKCMFVEVNSQREAHFLCGVLNSATVSGIVSSYVVDNSIGTHPVKNIAIPTFRRQNALHLRIAELSKKAHAAARLGRETQIDAIETELDSEVARLWH